MRLIDADALKKDLSENYVFYGFRQLLNDFYEALDSAPSIEIIRCRECKWWNKEVEFCTRVSMCMKADDFCSYGKVSEKPTGSEKPNNSTVEQSSAVKERSRE